MSFLCSFRCVLLKISFGSQHHNGHDLGTLQRRRWSGSGGGVTVGGGGYSSVPLLRGEDNAVRAHRDTPPPLRHRQQRLTIHYSITTLKFSSRNPTRWFVSFYQFIFLNILFFSHQSLSPSFIFFQPLRHRNNFTRSL